MRDVDLIVLNTTTSQQAQKQFLVRTNPRFYLIASTNPLATYQVLWFRTSRGARVKVDLLQPGIMSIPAFSPRDILRKGDRDTPVAPYEVVLLLKLQGWDDHRRSSEARYNHKQHVDVEDIRELLKVAPSGISFNDLPTDFMLIAREWVVSFAQRFPDSEPYWKVIGFETE
ncbi:hypothetical protein BDV93DRAFT_552138 [Ceratobasidium sp. AG-I]|nr:hypothetical protein BDV93DRAFT_552138 [Ceratobasidium sp. AG-I]